MFQLMGCIDYTTWATHTRTHETQGFEQYGLRRRVPHLCKCQGLRQCFICISIPAVSLAANADRASAGILYLLFLWWRNADRVSAGINLSCSHRCHEAIIKLYLVLILYYLRMDYLNECMEANHVYYTLEWTLPARIGLIHAWRFRIYWL